MAHLVFLLGSPVMNASECDRLRRRLVDSKHASLPRIGNVRLTRSRQMTQTIILREE